MASFPAAGALVDQIAAAMRNPARMPAALVSSSGFTLAAASVALIVEKAPQGIFLRLHDGAPACAYYGLLGATALYGLAEASFGAWAVARDPACWRAAGRVVLWPSSLPPLVLIGWSSLSEGSRCPSSSVCVALSSAVSIAMAVLA